MCFKCYNFIVYIDAKQGDLKTQSSHDEFVSLNRYHTIYNDLSIVTKAYEFV